MVIISYFFQIVILGTHSDSYELNHAFIIVLLIGPLATVFGTLGMPVIKTPL
jgi:hypothetical protein